MAIKRTGVTLSLMGEEFKRFLKDLEVEERSALSLGETNGPLLDLYETAEAVVIEADLPGIEVHDLDVSFLNGLLMIEGMKREKVEESEKINYLCMERSFEAFKRIIKIAMPINPKGASASYQKGVLTVSFPKVNEKRGERIKVKIEKK